MDTRSTKLDMRSLQDENSLGSGKHFSTDCARQQNLNSSVILQYRENQITVLVYLDIITTGAMSNDRYIRKYQL